MSRPSTESRQAGRLPYNRNADPLARNWLPKPSVPTAPAPDRDNHFNFLRLCLASLVLLAHAPELVDGDRRREPLTRVFGNLSCGELAVAGFFLLSGFLIVQSWQRQPRLQTFLANRALRIYPGFVVASLVSVCVVGALGAADARHYLARIDLPGLLQNVVFLRAPSTPPTFAGTAYAAVNANLWTISYEFACYLCAAGLGVCGLIRRRGAFLAFTLGVGAWWLLPLIALPIITFIYNHLGVAATKTVCAILRFDQENAVSAHLLLVFCAGGCFASFRDRLRFSIPWACAALAVTVPCMFSLVGSQLALVTLGAYAFFTFAFTPVPGLAAFRGHTDISYGVYLYGWPVQKLLLWCWPGLSPWTLFALSAVGSTLAGWLSWQFVEHPCLRLKRQLPAARPLPAPIPFAPPPVRG